MAKQISTLELIIGPMFAGKTEELIKRAKRARHEKKKVEIFKPIADTRAVDEIIAREKPLLVGKDNKKHKFQKKDSLAAKTVESFSEAIALVERIQPNVLGLDEIELFPDWITDLVDELLHQRRQSIRIIASGLVIDAWRNKFGSTAELMMLAPDNITILDAACFTCGRSAVFTQKVSGSENQIEIGNDDKYEARCRIHYTSFNKPTS